MKEIRLVNKDLRALDYDVTRLVKVMADRGFNATREQCYTLWKRYSNQMAAGWMRLEDNDDQIFYNLQSAGFEEV